jgi:TRAP-type C4-dicarboxylate transport system permease small subunit
MSEEEVMGHIIVAILAIVAFYLSYKWTKKKIEKKEPVVGTKGEWFRVLITFAGIIIVSVFLLSIDFNLAGYALLFIFIWVIFVWVILPRFVSFR